MRREPPGDATASDLDGKLKKKKGKKQTSNQNFNQQTSGRVIDKGKKNGD